MANHLECNYPFESNAVAILYLSYRNQREQSARNLIGSLVRQVAHRKTTLSDDVIGLYGAHKLKESRPTMNELSNLLHSEITRLSEVFILVDAMDECSANDYTREELLTTLQRLLKLPNVRLMITSRPVASYIESHLQGTAYLEIRAADEDLRKYIENRIPKERRLIPYVRGDDAFRAFIIDTIIAKAQGMYVVRLEDCPWLVYMLLTSVRFLMAQLHLGSLATKTNKRAVRLALQRLPEKLDDVYADAITRISIQDEEEVQLAKRTLMWISCAKRPLSIIELQHALAIEPGDKEIDPESIPDEDSIVEVCTGLVAIDRESRTIRLVHYTTQDYLARVRAELFATAEIDMTCCCLTNLLFSTSTQISEPGESNYTSVFAIEAKLEAAYPFWSYAARFWGSHAHEKAQYDSRTQHLVFQLLEPNSEALGLARSEPFRDNLTYCSDLRDVPGIHTAAYFDLTGLAETLLDRGTLVDARDDSYDLTALHCAAIRGHVATLRLLLDRGASIDMPNKWGDTPLMMATQEEHKDSVQFLLEKGADVDRQNRYRWTALCLAASSGHQSIMELLLKKGVDINERTYGGGTALIAAAESGHEDSVQFLLKNGADVNGQGYSGQTALFSAAQRGHQRIVELLLEKSADVNGQDFDGGTALFLAAERGHQRIVELLLEKGADVNGQDYNGGTALYIAAIRRRQSVVELLLGKGADINARFRQGGTALFELAFLGEDSMLKFLLRYGADVNVRRHDGTTALHVAADLGGERIVQLLIDAGADLEAKKSFKDLRLTASDIAKRNGHMDVFELLQKAREQPKTLPIRDLTQSQKLVDESNGPAD